MSAHDNHYSQYGEFGMEPLTDDEKRAILTRETDISWRLIEDDDDLQREWDDLTADGNLYRHKKGGVYRKLYEGRHADDGSAVIIYEHVWPHEREIWVRDKAEFEDPGRFERIGHD